MYVREMLKEPKWKGLTKVMVTDDVAGLSHFRLHIKGIIGISPEGGGVPIPLAFMIFQHSNNIPDEATARCRFFWNGLAKFGYPPSSGIHCSWTRIWPP
jgi:hypothetical protein